MAWRSTRATARTRREILISTQVLLLHRQWQVLGKDSRLSPKLPGEAVRRHGARLVQSRDDDRRQELDLHDDERGPELESRSQRVHRRYAEPCQFVGRLGGFLLLGKRGKHQARRRRFIYQ